MVRPIVMTSIKHPDSVDTSSINVAVKGQPSPSLERRVPLSSSSLRSRRSPVSRSPSQQNRQKIMERTIQSRDDLDKEAASDECVVSTSEDRVLEEEIVGPSVEVTETGGIVDSNILSPGTERKKRRIELYKKARVKYQSAARRLRPEKKPEPLFIEVAQSDKLVQGSDDAKENPCATEEPLKEIKMTNTKSTLIISPTAAMILDTSSQEEVCNKTDSPEHGLPKGPAIVSKRIASPRKPKSPRFGFNRPWNARDLHTPSSSTQRGSQHHRSRSLENKFFGHVIAEASNDSRPVRGRSLEKIADRQLNIPLPRPASVRSTSDSGRNRLAGRRSLSPKPKIIQVYDGPSEDASYCDDRSSKLVDPLLVYDPKTPRTIQKESKREFRAIQQINRAINGGLQSRSIASDLSDHESKQLMPCVTLQSASNSKHDSRTNYKASGTGFDSRKYKKLEPAIGKLREEECEMPPPPGHDEGDNGSSLFSSILDDSEGPTENEGFVREQIVAPAKHGYSVQGVSRTDSIFSGLSGSPTNEEKPSVTIPIETAIMSPKRSQKSSQEANAEYLLTTATEVRKVKGKVAIQSKPDALSEDYPEKDETQDEEIAQSHSSIVSERGLGTLVDLSPEGSSGSQHFKSSWSLFGFLALPLKKTGSKIKRKGGNAFRKGRSLTTRNGKPNTKSELTSSPRRKMKASSKGNVESGSRQSNSAGNVSSWHDAKELTMSDQGFEVTHDVKDDRQRGGKRKMLRGSRLALPLLIRGRSSATTSTCSLQHAPTTFLADNESVETCIREERIRTKFFSKRACAGLKLAPHTKSKTSPSERISSPKILDGTVFNVRVSLGYLKGFNTKKMDARALCPDEGLVFGYAAVGSSSSLATHCSHVAESKPLPSFPCGSRTARQTIVWSNNDLHDKTRGRLYFSVVLENKATGDSRQLFSPEIVYVLVGVKRSEETLPLGYVQILIDGQEVTARNCALPVLPIAATRNKSIAPLMSRRQKQRMQAFIGSNYCYHLDPTASLRVRIDVKSGIPGAPGPALWGDISTDDESFIHSLCDLESIDEVEGNSLSGEVSYLQHTHDSYDDHTCAVEVVPLENGATVITSDSTILRPSVIEKLKQSKKEIINVDVDVPVKNESFLDQISCIDTRLFPDDESNDADDTVAAESKQCNVTNSTRKYRRLVQDNSQHGRDDKKALFALLRRRMRSSDTQPQGGCNAVESDIEMPSIAANVKVHSFMEESSDDQPSNLSSSHKEPSDKDITAPSVSDASVEVSVKEFPDETAKASQPKSKVSKHISVIHSLSGKSSSSVSSRHETPADKAASWILQRMKATGLFSVSSDETGSSYESSVYNASTLTESVASQDHYSVDVAAKISKEKPYLESLRRAREHCKSNDRLLYEDAKKRSYHEFRNILSIAKRLQMNPEEAIERMERGEDLQSLVSNSFDRKDERI